MAALPIIKHFEVFKDLRLGLFSCVVLTMIDQFSFQGAKEALDADIVPTASSPRHAPSYARGLQLLLGGRGGILTPAIGMMEQTRLRVPSLQRHVQCVLRQLPRESIPHGPAHHGR